ncbi:MAG TPA: alpha/beta fold hydrolase, partial [Steroidobacteraceae bacterium]|nr:alpha/beta fold hydrolase [Steroidobacteraceae bacterium]
RGDRGILLLMARPTPNPRRPAEAQPSRVRRGYFECRYGQLHVHNSMPPGGGFEEGTPLLCLHDMTGSGWVFARCMALAGQERSVYAPDLPGFGESDPPAARPSIADYGAALGDFLDSMRLRQVDVLAQRAGTTLAAELAATRPAQIGRVVMVSVPLLSEAERQGRAVTPPAAELPGRSPEWQRWGAEAAAQYPLRERLARLSQRLLVLRPRDDLWDATGRVRDVQPAARVTDLEMSGAELFSSSPERLLEALREFLHR